MSWGSSHNWSAPISGYRLFRKERSAQQEEAVAFDVKGQWQCMEICLGMGDETTESLCVSISGQNNMRWCYVRCLIPT